MSRATLLQRTINSHNSTVETRNIVLTTLNTPLLLDPFFADNTIISVNSDNNANQLQLPVVIYDIDRKKVIKIFNSSAGVLQFRLIAQIGQTFNGTSSQIQFSAGACKILQLYDGNTWTITA